MRYKTLFRIICKAIGVYFVINGVGGVLSTAASVAANYMAFASVGRPGSYSPWWYVLSVVSPLFQIAAGSYLFFDGRRVADLALPGNRPYCPECGYDLSASTSGTCPECGVHQLTGRQE
jgi:hypothetical protein